MIDHLRSLLNSLASLPTWFLGYLSALLGHKGPFAVTTLTAPDASITAKFVSFGATLTELWVRDKDGKLRNVVLGYDDNSKLKSDPGHPVFNSIVGRYANRLKNGTFTIPISKDPDPESPNTFKVTRNFKNHSLHGGIIGWDRQNWSIESESATSVTYKHVDNADEGFPGKVTAYVTHSVSNSGVLKTTIHATASELTPIMLTQHIYWNLDAFKSRDDAADHILRVDASKILETDELAMPTGGFKDVEGTVHDFRTPHPINERFSQDCTGYNNCFILDKPDSGLPSVSLQSPLSGICVEVTTNQPTVIVYTSDYLKTPRKLVHGGPSKTYAKHSAIAIEQQGHVDAINNPEWGVDQIYGPGKDYIWSSEYKFSVTQ